MVNTAGNIEKSKNMIQVTPDIAIDKRELHEQFIQASGPGGQNVNKVATAVKLCFDVTHSPSLPDGVRKRLIRLAGRRVTRDGIIIIDARRFRTQERNREDAMERLVELIRKAAEEPKVRRKTGPSPGSVERRLENKHHRSETKRLRSSVPGSSE
jgi:ribosome-associated protein